VAKLLGTGKAFADTVVGTPYYLSPELVQDKPYNGQSDMWALGVILYECCTLKRPFEANNQCALILKIVRGHFEPVPPENVSSGLIEIVDRLLVLDPRRRPSARKLLSNPRVQRELLSLGLTLPADVESTADRPRADASADASSTRDQARPRTSSDRVYASARLENLAKPRPEPKEATTPSMLAPPPPLPPRGVEKGVLRGGRVRGGGERVNQSRRATRVAPRASPAPNMAELPGDLGPSPPQEKTPPSEARPRAETRVQRPTVGDLLKLKQSKEEGKEEDGAKEATQEASGTPAEGKEGEGTAEPPAEAKGAKEAEARDFVACEDRRFAEPETAAVPELVESGLYHSTDPELPDLGVEGDAAGGQGPRTKLAVLGWSGRERSGPWGRAEEVDEVDEDEENDEDDYEDDYEDDPWEEEDADESGFQGECKQGEGGEAADLSQLARSARERCVAALGGATQGGEETFHQFYRELSAPSSDFSMPDFFGKVTAACQNDSLKAREAVFCIQKILAAESGLREEKAAS